MERLTYRNTNGGKAYLHYGVDAKWKKAPGYDVLNNAIQKLADYEDAEDHGLLLRLPCKTGDTIWESDEHLPTCLTECVVDRFGFDEGGKVYCVYSSKDGTFTGKRYLSEFGKNLFLTKDEPIQAGIEADGRVVMIKPKIMACGKCGYLIEHCRCRNPRTHSDHIRANDDVYMSVQIAGCIVSYLVQNKIIEGTEADHKELISGISDDVLEWLQSEVEA